LWNGTKPRQVRRYTARMPAGSEFHTEGAATLKPREANIVWTRGADNRLVLEEHRERGGMW